MSSQQVSPPSRGFARTPSREATRGPQRAALRAAGRGTVPGDDHWQYHPPAPVRWLRVLADAGHPGLGCGPSTDQWRDLRHNGARGYHIHAHLTIYVNGQRVTVPKGIGIVPDSSCFYLLHLHTSDGIIHIEAPQKQHNEALDDFLTIWHDGFAHLGFPAALTQQKGWRFTSMASLQRGRDLAPQY